MNHGWAAAGGVGLAVLYLSVVAIVLNGCRVLVVWFLGSASARVQNNVWAGLMLTSCALLALPLVWFGLDRGLLR